MRHGRRGSAAALRVSEILPCDSMQWTPAPEFVRWLAPRLAPAGLVRPHDGCLMGRRTGPSAARAASDLAGRRPHPAGPGAARRVDLFLRPRAGGPRLGGADRPRRRPLREGRSSVHGVSARPMPGLPAQWLTFAGRLRGDKAPDLLVEALALMTRDPLTRLIRDRGPDAVVHLPGWSFEPARYIAGPTVHVAASREESWSQSAELALGLGVPVVGTAGDGLARTLAEGRGVLVPTRRPAHQERTVPVRACRDGSPPGAPGQRGSWPGLATKPSIRPSPIRRSTALTGAAAVVLAGFLPPGQQVSRLAVQHPTEPGERGEPDRSRVPVLQDRQVHDRDADPLGQLGERQRVFWSLYHRVPLTFTVSDGAVMARGG
jgi:hypothetical protein